MKINPTQIACSVHKALQNKGIEHPILNIKEYEDIDCRLDKIACLWKSIINNLGLNASSEMLCGSPKRIAKMYIENIFYGLDYRRFPKINLITTKGSYEQGVKDPIIVKDIPFISICEHHFIIFEGYAHVAYIPKNHILGLSKINEIVKFFSRRPQIQERLSQQIAVALITILGTNDVAVALKARHFCVKALDEGDFTSWAINTSMRGSFLENSYLNTSFLQLAGMKFSVP